jgi:hypothetical protein
MELVDRLEGCAALFVIATDDGVKETRSKSFDRVVKPSPAAP